MGTINIPNSFSPNTTISSSDVNNNFSTIANAINGNLDANNLATGAATTTKIADANVTTAKIADASITNAKMSAEVKPVTITSEVAFDFVASGCVWSGDAYASTRVASMTSGVIYVGGVRATVTTVTSRTFTASKDTYIDVDNTGTITYTEVTNNAASPALSAGRVRIGIIVTGATTIAAAGSVNQGQEDRVLPIASSVAYSVTDSLGNLICPRDPQRKILGYKQITANATQTSATLTAITGLSCPVIVPTGRKVKVSFIAPFVQNTTSGNNSSMAVADATTILNVAVGSNPGANKNLSFYVESITTPSATSKTYNAYSATDAGTVSIIASATPAALAGGPTFIKVELV